MITVNGQQVEAEGKSLSAYLAEAGFDPKRIAVERNGEIVPKARYQETLLHDGDVLEVVRFVGGG